jgi:hypothetical protein
MEEFFKWGDSHGISHGSLIDLNYGLSFPSKGTVPFMNRCILARLNLEQRDNLIKMGVDQMFISPPLIRKTCVIYLLLIYYSDKRNVIIDPRAEDYLDQLYNAYKIMYDVFLLQYFSYCIATGV